MQLSTVAKNNLETLKASNLSDENFNKILLDCISMIIANEKFDDKDLMIKSEQSDVTPEIINAAYIDLSTILVEASRHDYNHKTLSEFLSLSEVLSESKLEILCDVYSKNVDTIKSILLGIGDCHPCIVDVSWKLDFCIKTSEDYSFNDCLYHINLTTKKHGVISNRQFTCSIYELQEFVYKLKEVVRHLEKLASKKG